MALLMASLSLGLWLTFRNLLAPKSGLATRLAGGVAHSSVGVIDIWQFRQLLPKRKSQAFRLRGAVTELPELAELLAAALEAGDSVFAALARVVHRSQGVLARELQRLFIALEFGADLKAELAQLSLNLPHPQIVEFCSKLSMALDRGSPLAQMLRELAGSARAEIRNDLLRQAGRNETRMLIPLVFLILPVTVVFAIYPSLQFFTIDYP